MRRYISAFWLCVSGLFLCSQHCKGWKGQLSRNPYRFSNQSQKQTVDASRSLNSQGPVKNCGSNPADIYFLLDASGSVGLENFQKQLNFIKTFVNTMKIGPRAVQIGVTTFSHKVKNQFWLKDHQTKESLLQAISNIPYLKGTTATNAGLDFIREHAFTPANGGRRKASKILVVITDGISDNPELTKAAAKKVHNAVTVLAVGVGGNVNKEELKAIASDERYMYSVASYDALSTIQAMLKKTACGGIVKSTPCRFTNIMATIDELEKKIHEVKVIENKYARLNEKFMALQKTAKVVPHIETGTVTIYSSGQEFNKMALKMHVTFKRPYKKPPKVYLSLETISGKNMLDARSNLVEFMLTDENLTQYGCDIKFVSGGKAPSKFASVKEYTVEVAWISVPHE